MNLHPEDLTQSGDIKRPTMRHIRELQTSIGTLIEISKRLVERIEALEREREDSKDG